MEKDDQEIKRRAILQRNWREPTNVNAIGQAAKEPLPSRKVPERPNSDETAVTSLAAEVATRRRPTSDWLANIPMPRRPVPLIELPGRRHHRRNLSCACLYGQEGAWLAQDIRRQAYPVP
ncbi:hypothetical protein E4U24_006019 [Claviceps purpurea]|nr:hypothetical protein E4U12_008302 [Claviceps purpurea]KAG6241720.1 hypothetical protein E4U24_006019 [Claviceps purpurea]